MNATKRLLTAAIAAGALGIGAGAFFACRQELSPGAQDGSAGAERRPEAAKYNDGNYDFYFKNGVHIYGDYDGYNSEPGGKTKTYEWYQSDIENWAKRLRSAGIEPEVFKIAWYEGSRRREGLYCWVRFDTDLLNGIGYTGRDHSSNQIMNDDIYIMTNGKLFNVGAYSLIYAKDHERFDNNFGNAPISRYIKKTSNDQLNRDVPAIIVFCRSKKIVIT